MYRVLQCCSHMSVEIDSLFGLPTQKGLPCALSGGHGHSSSHQMCLGRMMRGGPASWGADHLVQPCNHSFASLVTRYCASGRPECGAKPRNSSCSCHLQCTKGESYWVTNTTPRLVIFTKTVPKHTYLQRSRPTRIQLGLQPAWSICLTSASTAQLLQRLSEKYLNYINISPTFVELC